MEKIREIGREEKEQREKGERERKDLKEKERAGRAIFFSRLLQSLEASQRRQGHATLETTQRVAAWCLQVTFRLQPESTSSSFLPPDSPPTYLH